MQRVAATGALAVRPVRSAVLGWAGAALVVLAVTCLPRVAGANLPLGACCFQTGVCQDLMSTQCDFDGGEFIGEGTACAEIDCSAPLVAPLLSIGGLVAAVGLLAGLGVYRLFRVRPRV